MTVSQHAELDHVLDLFEDWASASDRQRTRRSPKRQRFAVSSVKLARCMRCGAIAEWDYAPAGDPQHYCDTCVPRGCDCNIIEEDQDIPGETVIETGPDGQALVWTRYVGPAPRQHTDSFGRLLPCCEYWFFPGGFPAPAHEER